MVTTICLAWCGFIICNGSSVGFLSCLGAVELTQQVLCSFCSFPGLKPARHYNLNNGSPLENRITSGKIKTTIFSITRSEVDIYCLSYYRGCPDAQAAVRTDSVTVLKVVYASPLVIGSVMDQRSLQDQMIWPCLLYVSYTQHIVYIRISRHMLYMLVYCILINKTH